MKKNMNLYENNFRLLREKSPEVADWVAQAGDDPRAEVIRCRDGMDNLRLRGLQGKSTYYYDMHEPLKEEREICEKFSFTPDRVTFLIGLGLGYTVEILRGKIEKGHKIVVIEKNPAILQKALAHTDFSDFLRSDQIIFSLPDRESIKKTVIGQALNRFPEDILLLASPRLMALDRDYRELYEQVVNFLADPIMMTCTGVNHGEIFALNEIENFPKFLFSPGIRNLGDKFKGIPAIIVGAGPSLQKNVQHLPAAKEKALIVATAPIVRVLLAHDLSPDLIVSIDFNKDNRIHFDGLCDLTASPLVYPSRLAPDIVRDYQGDLFAIQDFSGLCGWLGKNWEFKGFVPGGASVSIYALMTVLFYGCDPIVFIGQDLAYTDRSHIDGVFLATRVNPAEPRGQFLWVEGVYGDRVPTIPPFLCYKVNIEEIIKRHPDREFINCTEGGAKIEGAEIMPLRECLQKYCSQPRAFQWFLQEAQNLEKVDWAGLVAEIGKRMTEVKEMKRLCQKGLKTNKKIKRKMQGGGLNDPETDQWILENYEASTAVQKFCSDFSLLKIFLRKETYKINRHQYTYIAEGAYDKREDLRIGLPRNRLILGAALKALNTVQKKLAYLHWLFRKILRAQETLASETARGEDHYRYGEVLARINLHRPAVEEFKKAIARGFAGSAVYRTLGKSYLKMDQLAKAEEVFTQGLERFPEIGLFAEEKNELTSIKNSWLEKAENYLKEDNWVNALLWSRKLLREDPSHVRGGGDCCNSLKASRPKWAAGGRSQPQRKPEPAGEKGVPRGAGARQRFDDASVLFRGPEGPGENPGWDGPLYRIQKTDGLLLRGNGRNRQGPRALCRVDSDSPRFGYFSF